VTSEMSGGVGSRWFFGLFLTATSGRLGSRRPVSCAMFQVSFKRFRKCAVAQRPLSYRPAVIADCESGIVGVRRMNHQFERAAVAESNGCEVTHAARSQTTDAERLGERHDRAVHEAQAEIREASVHFHRP